jgi:hypothetical protein
MAPTLVKTVVMAAGGRIYPVRYFERRSSTGAIRYSAELRLRPRDRVIIDDDSLERLEARTAALIPATIDSRRLSKTA